MNKIKYYTDRITSVDYSKMIKTITKISKRSGKSRMILLVDILSCQIKYQAGYVDYDMLFFEEKSAYQRSTFITRGINENYSRTLNDKAFYKFFDDKILFNQTFKDFITRDFMIIGDNIADFKKFIKKNPIFFAKVVDGSGGKGVERYDSRQFDLKNLYKIISTRHQILLEQVIQQHPKMDELFPNCVNTLRLVTVLKQGKAVIVMRVLRIGSGESYVDNFHRQGMFTFIDSNGHINKPAIDMKRNIYETHPNTAVNINGFQVPLFKQACDLVRNASLRYPEVAYVAWDVAIGVNGVELVEGNTLPGYDLYQSKVHINDDGTGFKAYFDDVIYGECLDDKED